MRIRTILAAAAVPAALAAALLGTAGAASAASQPSTVDVPTQKALDDLVVNGAINKNINITAKADQNVWLGWTTVNGNVSIAPGGHLSMSGDYITGNVTDHGYLALQNYATEIHGGLTVTGSAGEYAGSWANAAFGDWTSYAGGVANLPPTPGSVTADNPNGTGQSRIDGGFTYTSDNTATALTNNMAGGGPLHVHGKFTYAGGMVTHDGVPTELTYQGGLQVDGQSVIS
jgi:hypothetical protein